MFAERFQFKRFRRNVWIDETGGKMIFVVLLSIAFALTGMFEKVHELPKEAENNQTELEENPEGRRYCDPPDMAIPDVDYDSNEDENDYQFVEHQEIFFQTNISSADLTELRAKIFSDLGCSMSYIVAQFFLYYGKPQSGFGYFFLFLWMPSFFVKSIRLEYCLRFIVGFATEACEFFFYIMVFSYTSEMKNILISFASVRAIGLVIVEFLFVSEYKFMYYILHTLSLFWFLTWWIVDLKFSRNKTTETKQAKEDTKRKFPWKSVLRSRPIWMTIIVIFSASSAWACILGPMRLYLKYIIKFPDNDLFFLIPNFLHVAFSIASGFSVFYLLSHNIVSVTSSRRMIVYLSHFIPSGLLFVLGFVGCDHVTPVIFYCLAVMMTGANYTGAYSSPLDLARQYAGPILAICFTFKALGSLFMNYLTLYILTEQVLVSWRFLFSLNSLILLLTAILFMLRGSGSIQPWSDPDRIWTKGKRSAKVQEARVSVVAPLPKQRTKSIYMVEQKILKVLHVQEPDKFTRVRAYSTSLPTDRAAGHPSNIYRPTYKKRASIS